MVEPEAGVLEVDGGLRLRLWEHAGAGPVVLMVHGYLDTGRSFDAVVEALGGRVQAVCLDWRGHGQSQWAPPGGSYHLLDHLKDLARVIHHLETQGRAPEALVAHSMGGNVALMLAGAWPQKVQRLLLLDAMGPPPEDPERQPERLGQVLQRMLTVRPFSRLDSWEEGVERIMATNYGLSRQGAERMARFGVVPDGEGGWVFNFDPRLRGPTPVRYPEAMWRAMLGRIEAPVRLLRAGRGYVPAGELLDGRLGACADAAIETLPEAVHALHVENPGEVARAVEALLALPR